MKDVRVPSSGGDQRSTRRGYRVTQVDVAAHAGVSPSTVSLALNGRSSIAADTCRRVEESARTLNYRSNQLARDLSTGTRHAIGVLMPLGDSECVPMVRSLVQMVTAWGYQVEVADSGVEPDQEIQVFRKLVESRPDAIVRAGSQYPPGPELAREMTKFHLSGLPIVTMSYTVEDSPIPYVVSRQEKMGRLAVRHLTKQGCARIGWAGGIDDVRSGSSLRSSLRYRGFLTALHESSLEPDFQIHPEHKRSSVEYEHALKAVLATEKSHAVVVNGTETGARALRIANEMGIAVPGDLAVVAIGAGPICDLVFPRMTSVGQPHEGYAEALSQILADVLVSPSGWDGRGKYTEPEIVVRDSSLGSFNNTAVATGR